MKTKTINVSIAGSCVCRDTFEIVKQYESFNQDAAKYLINMYIQSISFASAVAPKLEKSLTDALVEESEKSEKANFFKKMFKIDVEKNYFDYLGSVKSDWLIIDMTPSRFKLLKIGESYLSYDLAITIATGCKESTPDSAMSLIKSGEVVDLIDYDADVLVRMCTEWVNEIKQLFSQKKIIIVKTKNAKTFTDEGVLFSQNSYDSSLYKHDDKLFEIAYNCVEKQLPNAYVIEALPTLVGNVQHKWGRFGLHYVDEVYMYLFSCFDYIMNTNASRENKYAYMLKQNRIYAERIFEKYVNISNNSIQTARNILDTVKGIKIGRYEKNGIVVNVEEGLCFSVEGTAKEDTVFYLYTKGGNPCGEWRSHEQHIPGGDYLFTTDFACQSDAYFVQLVLTDNDNNRRWIYGHLAGEFTLDHDYTYCLIRLVIRKGVSINSTGRLFLESTKKSKTGNTV